MSMSICHLSSQIINVEALRIAYALGLQPIHPFLWILKCTCFQSVCQPAMPDIRLKKEENLNKKHVSTLNNKKCMSSMVVGQQCEAPK